MKDEEIEFSYALAKISNDYFSIYRILRGIFGTFAFVLIYKFLRRGRI